MRAGNQIIDQIVDRCYVGQTNLSVIRYFLSRVLPGAWRTHPKGERKKILRAVIKRHNNNRAEYRAVMRGAA